MKQIGGTGIIGQDMVCGFSKKNSTRGKKYGVRQYKNSSDPTLERVGDSVGLIANAGVGENIVRNDFDYISLEW